MHSVKPQTLTQPQVQGDALSPVAVIPTFQLSVQLAPTPPKSLCSLSVCVWHSHTVHHVDSRNYILSLCFTLCSVRTHRSPVIRTN